MTRQRDPVIERVYRSVLWFFLGLALLRAGLFLASDPLMGLANNYDMIRIQSCIEAYPVREDGMPVWASNPEAPLEKFRFTPGVPDSCAPGTQLLFAWAAWPGMWVEQHLRADETFSIRWMGAVKCAFLFLLVAWGTRRLLALGRVDVAAAHGALVALVVCDPGNLIYFHSFYSEASALLLLHALLLCLTIALLCEREPGNGLLTLVALSAVLLAMSKFQNLVLPLVILVITVIFALSRHTVSQRAIVALGLGALVGVVLQLSQMHSVKNESMRSANVVDTLFMAMLPNASEPARLLEQLRLPAECIQYSGASWYTPGMIDRKLCPEVFALRHFDLALPLLRDPLMALRTVLGGMERLSSWIPTELGVVEGEATASLPPAVPSWSPLLQSRSMVTKVFVFFGLPIAGVLAVFRGARGQRAAIDAILLSLSTLPICVLAIAVFGDGYMDLPKHAHLGIAAMLAAIVLFVCLAIDRAVHVVLGRARPEFR